MENSKNPTFSVVELNENEMTEVNGGSKPVAWEMAVSFALLGPLGVGFYLMGCAQ